MEGTKANTFTIEDENLLIQNIKDSNKKIKHKIFILFAIIIIALTFVINSVAESEKRREYVNDTIILKEILTADKPKEYLKDFISQSYLSFPTHTTVNYFEIEEELEKQNYESLKIVEETLKVIEEKLSHGKKNENEVISFIGVEIKYLYMGWFIPLIIFIIIQNITSNLGYRRNLLKIQESKGIEQWKIGHDFWGKQINSGYKEVSGFINLISNFIHAVFFILILITNALFIGSVPNFDVVLFEEILIGLNVSLIIITFANILNIIYYENIFNIKSTIKHLLGEEYGQGKSFSTENAIIIFIISLIVPTFNTFELFEQLSFSFGHFFYAISIFITSLILPFGVILKNKDKTKKLYKRMVFVGAVMQFFWLFFLIFMTLMLTTYRHASPGEVFQLEIAILVGAYIMSLYYTRYVK